MKKSHKHPDVSVPQTVTGFIKLLTGQKTIQIGFTNQKVSAHAGLASFASFLHWHQFHQQLTGWLPHQRSSPNALAAADVALGFIIGILAGAKKLAQVAYLRGDRMVAPLLEIKRIASQSSFTRFFQGFTGAGANLATFQPSWRWCLDRLRTRPGGYTLDLDSTQLLHEDGHQEGVRTGHTPLGCKRCLHPLLAIVAEAKLVAGFWLRPGNVFSDNNVVNFTWELLGNLPLHIRLRLVRADSGFCHNEWLELLENKGLHYIVVARLYRPLQRLLRKGLHWTPTEIAGTEVAEMDYQQEGWPHPRRLVLYRHRIAEKKRPGGKHLLDCPGYCFQALVTNLPSRVSAVWVWRDYNGRAGSENVIKELDASFGLPQLCLKKFWATEGALWLAVLAYNLCILFQRRLGWLQRVNASTLRFRLFRTGGIISQSGGFTTIRLAVHPSQRSWWRAVFEKLLSPYPNCNAVEQWPP